MTQKIKTFWSKFREVMLFIGVIVLVSVIVDASLIRAADDEEAEYEIVEGGSFQCYEEVIYELTALDEDLAEFLNQSFESAEVTTDLVDLVMEKYYVEYIGNVNLILANATQLTGGENSTEVSERMAECRGIADKHITMNEEILKAQIGANASAKKTTALLDEYKWLNERLSDMNITVGKIEGYLSKMDSGLTGFTQTCVKQ